MVGPIDAGDEARAIGRARGPLVAAALRQPRAFEVQLVDERLEPVVGLRDRRAAERVGLDDVAAGLEVLAVDAGDDVGPRQHEQVVVAPEIARMVREPLAAEVRLGQLVALDHRPHRAVEDEDPRRQQRVELGPHVRLHRHAFPVTRLRASCVRFVAEPVLRARRDQHRERIAGLARADADLHVAEARGGQHALQLLVVEAEARGRRAWRAPTLPGARADRAAARGRPAP